MNVINWVAIWWTSQNLRLGLRSHPSLWPRGDLMYLACEQPSCFQRTSLCVSKKVAGVLCILWSCVGQSFVKGIFSDNTHAYPPVLGFMLHNKPVKGCTRTWDHRSIRDVWEKPFLQAGLHPSFCLLWADNRRWSNKSAKSCVTCVITAQAGLIAQGISTT